MSNYGYEKGFIVEHDNTLKKSIACTDCIHYEREDKSCTKTGRYLPEDGYNSWAKCDSFVLRSDAPNYDVKKKKLVQMGRQESILASIEMTVNKTQDFQGSKTDKKKLHVEKIWLHGNWHYKIKVNDKYAYCIPCKDVSSKQAAIRIVVEELKRMGKM